MSDQCKHCMMRGKYAKCLETPCSHHEDWISIKCIERIKQLEQWLKWIAAHSTFECEVDTEYYLNMPPEEGAKHALNGENIERFKEK